MSVDGYYFIDLESTGLCKWGDPMDYILEIGGAVYDSHLNRVANVTCMVGDHATYNRLTSLPRDDVALAMHKKSGLWDEWMEAFNMGTLLSPREAEIKMIEHARNYGVDNREPMCGSTIRFDRHMLDIHMRELDETFSYRVIDISSFREEERKVSPIALEQLEKNLTPAKSHRVQDDIADSAELFAHLKGLR